jgi:peptidase YpeB-like protein
MDKQRRRLVRVAAVGAVTLGLIAGSYGVASAASGSGSNSSPSPGLGLGTAQAAANAAAPSAQRPWGGQRSDETLLTGDTKSKVQAAAEAKLPGATVVRVETDADGNAAYEVHMVKADGTRATVYVDQQFDVVSVQTGMPGPSQQQPQA